MASKKLTVRFWVFLGVIYVLVSLALINRLEPEANSAGGRDIVPAWSGADHYAEILTRPSEAPDGRQWTFEIPIAEGALDNVESYDFSLESKVPLHNCNVQVIVECDHHLSYSHVYRVDEIGPRGFPFHVPFRDVKAYWAALDHDGVWSSWNTLGLRKLEVKVFFAKRPFNVRMSLAFQPNELNANTSVALAWAQPMSETIRLGERFELAFDVAGWRGNFFDYEQAGFQFDVIGPNGESHAVIPFLYQNFESVTQPKGEVILPKGPKHFRARFRPSLEGEYTYELRRTEDEKTTILTSGTFDVLEGPAPQWVRVSRRNPRYFELADGSFFYPVGWCAAYPTDNPYGSAYVPYLPKDQRLSTMFKLIDDLGASGANISRLWLSEWWNGIEWSSGTDNYGGIGRYNLKNAWITDEILRRCETQGIYLSIDMLTNKCLSTNSADAWRKNPYATINGGRLSSPNRFWTDSRIMTPLEKRLAYIIARFADSPAVHCWGFMCEADLESKGVWRQAKARITQQLEFVKGIDPYAHITSNHVCRHRHDMSLYREPSIEFLWSNAYTHSDDLPIEQPFAIRTYSDHFASYQKPVLIGESVAHWGGDPVFKIRKDSFTSLWAAVASRLSGAPVSWWWNFNYGEDMGRFYGVVAEFMKNEDLILEDTPENGYWRNLPAECSADGGDPEVLMVGNKQRRFLYLYNYDAACRANLEPGTCRDSKVKLGGMNPGTYAVEYWDTRTGKTDIVQELKVGDSGKTILEPPDFSRDWAIKIRPKNGADESLQTADLNVSPVEVSAPASISPKLVQAGEWAWTITPDVPVLHPKAAERCFYELFIALPEALYGYYPAVLDSDGNAAKCSWEFLENKTGWHIQIPASQKGPFRVTAAKRPKLIEYAFDERNVGLHVRLQKGPSGSLSRPAYFYRLFANSKAQQVARVSTIDQVRPPFGRREDSFLALYEGPLLVDADGRWTFGINSDDGSFLCLDDKEIVQWLGGHWSDSLVGGGAMPGMNRWTHRSAKDLQMGIHWIALYHQEETGDELARVGWRTSTTHSTPMEEAFAHTRNTWQVIPADVLDGRIPFTLHIERNGKELGALLATQGVRLRRPDTSIHVAATQTSDLSPKTSFFVSEGYKLINLGGTQVPVWVHNAHFLPFSIEWDQGKTETGSHFIQTLCYDANLPLRMRIGKRDLGERLHTPRAEVFWDIQSKDRDAEFVLSLGNIDLLHEKVSSWFEAPSEIVPLPENVKFKSIVLPSTLNFSSPLSGKLFKPWYGGKKPPEVMASRQVLFDIWSHSPEELLPYINKGEGVMLLFDRRAFSRGLTETEVYARLSSYTCAIIEAGAFPVLVVEAGHNMASPSTQRQALAFMQVANEWNCPFVDLGGQPNE